MNVEELDQTHSIVREMRDRTASIPQQFLNMIQLESVLNAAQDESTEVPPVVFEGTEIPRLNPDARLEPITHIDDLIDLLVRFTHDPVDDPDNAERLIAGFANAMTIVKAASEDSRAALKTHLLQYLNAWKRDTATLVRLPGFPCPLDEALRDRFLRVAHAFLSDQTIVVLSTPTHRGGWIDARELVRRVLEHRERKSDLRDECLAILRLAPDCRNQALELLKQHFVPGNELHCALSYALGDTIAPSVTTDALWIAAARSRAPFADDLLLSKSLVQDGPDAALSARYRLLEEKVWLLEGDARLFDVIIREPVRQAERVDLKNFCYTIQLCSRPDRYGYFMHHTRWSGTIWPIALESFFAAGVERLAGHNEPVSAMTGLNSYLEKLYDPDVPLKPMATLALLLGLTAKSHQESLAAVDALIQVIEDGRLEPGLFGRFILEVLHRDVVRPVVLWAQNRYENVPLLNTVRIAKSLNAASVQSGYHRLVVALIVEHLLQGDAANPMKDLHAMLEVLLEQLSELGIGLQLPASREYLSRLTATGKAQKLAKQLLKQKTVSVVAVRNAWLYAAEQRLLRAERWVRWQANSQ